MKNLIALAIVLIVSVNLLAQENYLIEHVQRGVALHDEGKYDEAIKEYNAALAIDSTSSIANYELSYTCMSVGKYADAIKYCRRVIEKNENHLEAAYISMGSSYDLMGDPEKAIKAYEEGAMKFPESNLLNYNLAYTLLGQKQYDRAEEAVIKAVIAKPDHGSSHIVLSSIMEGKGERVKSILPLYYFLLVEPTSKRSQSNYAFLVKQLMRGVERTGDNNININVPMASNNDSLFGAAEMFISMHAATTFFDKNSDRSDMENFVEMTKGLFRILGELKKDNTGFWWDFYVTLFSEMERDDHCEAFCYYISQSANTDEVANWLNANTKKLEKLQKWFEN
jgi:Tfp pilus assembly protein PilF